MIITREKGMRMWGGGSGSTSASGVNGGGGFSLAVTEGEGTGNAYTDFTYESGTLTLNKGSEFVTVDFFNKLFTAYDANGNVIAPNNTTPTLDNIKFKAGAWTEQYLSALGQNSSGGGGGGGIELSDVWQSLKTNTDDYANQKINAAHIPDLSGTYATKTWVNQQGFLTTHQTLYTLSIYGGTTKVLDFKPNANASIYIKAGGDISLTNDTTNKYITLSYTHPTNGANTTISAASGKVLSAITVNNLGHVTSVSSKTLASADIPDLSGTYATASRATTLEGYFTNGVAKTAAKLNTGTTTYTAWGQTYWSSGVPQSISGNMTSVGSITPSANGNALGTTSARFNIYGTAGNFSGNVSITGTLGVTGATTLTGLLTANGGIVVPSSKTIKIGDCTISWDSTNSMLKFDTGIYSTGPVSALGSNSSGGGSGTFDEEAMWTALGTTSTAKVIASSHIPNLAASKITSGTLAAARIPNLSWNKITSDLPTTLDGYGITNAFSQTQSFNRFYSLYDGKAIEASSSSTVDLDTITDVGSYYCQTNTASGNVTNKPADRNIAFRMWVSAPTGTTAGYRRQRFQFYDQVAVYERIDTNLSSVSWGNWYKVQDSLADYASASSVTTLQGYFTNGVANSATSATTASKLSTVSKTAWGQTYWTSGGVPTDISGALSDVTNITMSGNIYLNNNQYIYTKDSGGTNRPMFYMTTANNLYIGYGSSAASGSTYVAGTSVELRYGSSRTTGLTLDSSGNVVLANSLVLPNQSGYIYAKDSDGTDRSMLMFSSGNNLNLGSGCIAAGGGTYIYGNSVTLRIGSTAATGNAVVIDSNKDMTVTGKVCVGTGGADSYLASDSATNIYLRNSSGAVLVCDGKVIRRSTSLSDVTLGSSTYPWGGVYSTTGTFNSNVSVGGTLDVTGAVTMSSNLTVTGWVRPIGNLVMGTSSNSMNADSGQIHFRTSYMTDFTKHCSPYIQAIGGSSYGRKRLSVFQNNGTSSDYNVAYSEVFTILANGRVGIGNTTPGALLGVSGDILASGEITASSDERKKNIISNTKFNVKDIASARSILYEWNDDRDKDNEKKIHGGSIAQDWLGKADSFLSQDNDGWYSINYGALALCSAITIAKEVVKHEDEITRLKKEVVKLRERVAELEERRAL